MAENPHKIMHQADVEAVIAAKHLTLETDELAHTAYELALAGGFVGNQAAWIASLEGAIGPAGPAGPVGPWGTFSATGVELANVAHAINTVAKVAGKQVWDRTANIPMFADGPLATDHWFTIAGVDTITPI